nr:MAG TPA: hypothetical protein [Caudoviricetes sp.]
MCLICTLVSRHSTNAIFFPTFVTFTFKFSLHVVV